MRNPRIVALWAEYDALLKRIGGQGPSALCTREHERCRQIIEDIDTLKFDERNEYLAQIDE